MKNQRTDIGEAVLSIIKYIKIYGKNPKSVLYGY